MIVKIQAAGVCRTDLHIITGRDLGIPVATLPHVLGHENAGEVYRIGEGVSQFKTGDKVSIVESKPFSKNKRFQVMESTK